MIMPHTLRRQRCLQGDLAICSRATRPVGLANLNLASMVLSSRSALKCKCVCGVCRVRALLATGAGGLLAGGTDAAIRAWAPATPAASYLVAAPPPPPSAAPLTDEVWDRNFRQLPTLAD